MSRRIRERQAALPYATPELLAQLRAGYLPTLEPTPDAALRAGYLPAEGTANFPSSSEIDTEMEEAIRLGDAQNAAPGPGAGEGEKSRSPCGSRKGGASPVVAIEMAFAYSMMVTLSSNDWLVNGPRRLNSGTKREC